MQARSNFSPAARIYPNILNLPPAQHRESFPNEEFIFERYDCVFRNSYFGIAAMQVVMHQTNDCFNLNSKFCIQNFFYHKQTRSYNRKGIIVFDLLDLLYSLNRSFTSSFSTLHDMAIKT